MEEHRKPAALCLAATSAGEPGASDPAKPLLLSTTVLKKINIKMGGGRGYAGGLENYYSYVCSGDQSDAIHVIFIDPGSEAKRQNALEGLDKLP